MTSNDASRNDIILGGTIAVPAAVAKIDPMDISCRSDLTQDIFPEYGEPSSHSSRPPMLPPRLHRSFLRKNSSDGAATPLPTSLRREVSESSHNSFQTASNFRTSEAPGVRPYGGDEDNKGDDDESFDLDEQAELAAMACFGADAGRVLDSDEAPRKSALVSENSTIDVSWFASRGIMSRNSFERYQEEMKRRVINGASSNNLKSLDKRRASISMGELRNEEWSVQTQKRSTAETAAVVLRGNLFPPPPLTATCKTLVIAKPLSVDEGLDRLVKSGDMDKLVQSIISALGNGNARDTSLLKSSLAKKSDKIENKTSESNLNSDEIKVLAKMIRRLSQEDVTVTLPQSDDDDCSIIPGETLESKVSTHRTTEDDLTDSSTWESNPSNDPIPVDKTTSVVHLTSSMTSSDTLKTGNALSTVTKDGNIASKYAPRRTSSSELKGTNPFQLRNVDFSSSSESGIADSFYTTAVTDRNDTLSSSMLSAGGEETDDDESVYVPLLPPVGNTRVDMTNFRGRDELGSMSPHKTVLDPDGRSESISTLSPKSQREDSQERAELAMPRLDRSQSTVSFTTLGAVASTELLRQDSIGTTNTMPQKDVGCSGSQKFQRGLPTGTYCPVVDLHTELDHFEKSNGNMTLGANHFPNEKDSRPARRHSFSSQSSGGRLAGGESLHMTRNSFSFSSLFTAQNRDTLEGPPLKEGCGDILQEGQEYLSMAMLVNVYSKLRELSMLGHASVKLVDIDVNSHQSAARKKEMKRLGLLESNEDLYLGNTKTAGAIVRTVLDEYQMFEASNELTSGAAVFNQANRAAMAYDASLLSEFKTWVEESKVKQLDSVTENVIKTLREECERRQLLLKERSSDNSLATMEHADLRRSVARRRSSLSERSDSFQAASWLRQERTLISDYFGVASGVEESLRDCEARDDSRRISRDLLTESIIKNTLDKSYDYFQEGSSLRNLLEAGLEVVWFSDRHPSDIIYCICVNRETATVTVVFRGQEGFVDLIRDSDMSKYSNPIVQEDYEGNSESINIRSAVSDELMRVRRDNKKSTIDEIREKVDKIGKELTDGGYYHLSVCGHSLGGGLATVAGFYLASDTGLELASAVRVFTFATSRVGCKAFQQGFKHLEETGRLQHARFTTADEVVSLLPIHDTYCHVGMRIRLHKPNGAGRQRTRQSLDVTYNSPFCRLRGAFHFMLNFLSATKSTRISEYQHRMHFAREYRLALSDGVLRFDKKRNHLKSLNDYYLMKCRLGEYMGFTKKQEAMPSFLLFFLVSCLVSFEIALLFKFVATW